MPLHRGNLSTDEIEITLIRPLTRADLEEIKTARTVVPVVARFRDPHHRAARLIAAGVRLQDVAESCGYSMTRLYTLNTDPAFRELIASYRTDVREAFIDAEHEHHAMATEVNRKALRHITEAFDKAEEDGELVPLDKALRVFSDTADRVGIQKRSTTTANVHVDFAKRLEDAIAKSNRVIDITPNQKTGT